MIELAKPLAAANNRELQGRLGRAYRDGKGVKQDLQKAAEWMKKAADQNLYWAIKELVEIYHQLADKYDKYS